MTAGTPQMSAVFNPGPPASIEIRTDDETCLPRPGDIVTNEGAFRASTHRVREIANHGGGRYTALLSCACAQCGNTPEITGETR